MQKTKEAFLQNSTLLDRFPQSTESDTHVLLSGQQHSLQRASYLEKMLLVKANEFEVHLIFPFKLSSWRFAQYHQFLISYEVIGHKEYIKYIRNIVYVMQVVSALWTVP